MAKRSVGSLFIDIEARTAKLEADLAKTRGILQRMNAQVGVIGKGFSSAFGIAKAAVAAFAGFAAVKSLKTMAMGALENVRAQMQLSETTRLGVNDLKAYQEASEHLGVSNLDLAKTMKHLDSLQYDLRKGSRTAKDEIIQMGFSVQEFANLGPAQLFEGTIQKLSQLKDVSLQTALAQKVFGKESTNLMVLIRQGGQAIATAREEMDRLGQGLTRLDTAKVTVAMEAVAELDDRWQVFKQRLAIGLTPLIFTLAKNFADSLAGIDMDKLVTKISAWTLATVSYIMSIPARVKLLFQEIQLAWFSFVSKFDTGGKDDFFAKIFGTQSDNKKKVAELEASIAALNATITAGSDILGEEFAAALQAALQKMGAIVVTVGNKIRTLSSGMEEVVHEFASAFSRIADLSDNFIDGEAVKFGDFFRELVKTMVKVFLKVSLINPLMNAVFGSMMGGTAGGWWTMLPAIFGAGAGKARGGPVMAGDTHVFGENGPEIGTVQRSGYITPNDRLVNRSGVSGVPTVVINQQFSSGLQRAELAAIVPSIIQQSRAAVADAVMRGGGYRRAVS